MTTTRIYRSTDASAPVVTGQTGTAVNLLKTCLVGSSGVAYGSKAAAGWSVPFADSSTKTVLRNSVAAGGTGCYLRVLDDGSGTGSFREAFMRCYGAMSDIDTGTDPCHTATQAAAGGVMRKSATLNSTARQWIVVADELTAYVWIEVDSTSSTDVGFVGFGDFDSEVAGDSYRYFLAAKTGINSTSGGANWANLGASVTSSPTFNDLTVGRSYTLTGTAQPAGLLNVGGSINSGSSSMLADPSPGGSRRYVVPLTLIQGATIRGALRGLYGSLTNLTAVAGGTAISPAPAGLPSDAALVVMPSSVAGQRGAVLAESFRSW